MVWEGAYEMRAQAILRKCLPELAARKDFCGDVARVLLREKGDLLLIITLFLLEDGRAQLGRRK
jgi:hypothetical protein